MKKGILRSFIVMMVAGLFTSTAPLARGDAYISWTFSGFSPSTVVVSPYEDVYWINNDLFFDLYLTLEGYGSVYLEPGFGASAWFDAPGSYDFSSDSGDYGSVIVNIPPGVTITNPVDNAVFAAPATFNIEADTTETPDDSIWVVEFYLGDSGGTNWFALDYDFPYNAPVTNLAAGTYTLIAVATDSRYWSATNAITITVGTFTTITLSAPRMSGGQFLFDVAGLTVGKTNVVQTSTNLTVWTPIKTNVAAAASATITNTPATGPHLYRVMQRP